MISNYSTMHKPHRIDRIVIYIIAGIAILVVLSASFLLGKPQTNPGFNASQAYRDLVYQVNLGPRVPGSTAHQKTIDWIQSQLTEAGWDVQIRDVLVNGQTAHNILARRGSGPIVMLGAHFDSRRFSDQDPNLAFRPTPVLGANDGASGVAVLLELARSLPLNINKEIWLVFFDLEDQGDIQGHDYIEGSTAFAAQMPGRPTKVVILDMIGDTNLDIYYEANSSKPDIQAIWKTAADLGYAQAFIPQVKYNMIDDHTPFLQAGIPAVDLIDFDYPSWHTTTDNLDHVSENSLKMVGDTLWHWLQEP